jgi:hypothetical protein
VGFNRLHQGILAMPLSAGKRLDQTTVLDIAALAACAFEHPRELAGQRIDLASDSLCGTEMTSILSQILGRIIPYQQLPIEQVRQWADNDIATTFERFEANEYYVDIVGLRASTRTSTGTISPAGPKPSTGSTSSAGSPSPGLDGAPPSN